MNDKLKKYGIWSGSILVGLYLLFLIIPFILSPFVDSYSDKIEASLSNATGFNVDLDDISLVTRPNLSVGFKVKNLTLTLPNEANPFFESENASVRLALLPLLLRKVQVDYVGAKVLSANLEVKKDGNFLIQDFIPKTEKETEMTEGLPYGFKLSNHLPNVKVKDYKLAFIDKETSKSYYMEGTDFKLSDFILDKHFKLSTKGKVVLDNVLMSNYDLKVYNKIMPKVQLDDLVFPKVVQEDENKTKTASEAQSFNIIDVFKSINNNKLGFDITTDASIFGTTKAPHLKGFVNVDALSVAVNGKKLPESYAHLKFKGAKTDIDSMFYTSDDVDEATQVIGNYKTGKNPSVDMTLRSNAKFNNIIRLIDSIASSFEINDFNTLSATGRIDADFNINSDMKKVLSTGYLKILPSSLTYGLYNVSVDNITADVDLTNNDINIKKAGFSVLGHPLKLSGTIGHDASLDLKLIADKLSLKGLLAACGQIATLKDNNINSGYVSINALILGKLNNIKPEISADICNLNVLNKPSNLKVLLKSAVATILYDGKAFDGNIDVTSLDFIHPSLKLSIPKSDVVVDNKDINIKNTYLLFDNSRIDIKGVITDYIQDKMNIDISAKGNVLASDILSVIPKDFRSLIAGKGKLPLQVNLTGNTKVQNIKLNVDADKDNYVSFVDIDLLKNQKTKVHSNIEIIGDSLTFSNTGVSNDKATVIKVSGGVSKLYSEPDLNINIAVPNTIKFPIWGVPTSSVTANGVVTVLGDVMDPQVRGTVNIIELLIDNMDLSIKDLVADLSGKVLNGSATARQFRLGGILADDLAADFSLENYTLVKIKNLTAKAFDGDVKGDILYDIPTTKINITMIGNGMNSTDAIYGAVGIKNALTGVLDFNADLSMKGSTDKDIINSLAGNVDFNVADGRFMGIGRLENLVAAQNVSSNSILKSAISALSTASTIQEANKYKYIKGNLTLSNGGANISKILVSGPLMAYYVTGVYNILPNSANLIILGRLESKVVSCLGVLGELSAEKLLSYIPKFGVMTSNILKQLTADPASENTSLIPQLSGDSTSYKDFKVIFNGPVSGTSSVKSFKWLSNCDTSEMNVKQDLKNAKEAVKSNIENRVEQAKTNAETVKTNVNNVIETQKNKVETLKESIEQTKTDIQNSKENVKQNSENIKNLLQNALKNSQKTMPSSESKVETNSAQ